uniref:Transposase n=1 Tax=Macrostomum lignano TaxID=282301 RepID=A0A1I8FDP8_9PLAT
LRLLRRLAARPVQLERYIRESEDQFLKEYQADLQQSAPAPGQPETQDRGRLRDDYEALKRRLAGSIFFRDKLRDKAPRCSWSRYFGEILFGLTCAMLWLGAFPTEWFDDDNRKQLIRPHLAAAHCSG